MNALNYTAVLQVSTVMTLWRRSRQMAGSRRAVVRVVGTAAVDELHSKERRRVLKALAHRHQSRWTAVVKSRGTARGCTPSDENERRAAAATKTDRQTWTAEHRCPRMTERLRFRRTHPLRQWPAEAVMMLRLYSVNCWRPTAAEQSVQCPLLPRCMAPCRTLRGGRNQTQQASDCNK